MFNVLSYSGKMYCLAAIIMDELNKINSIYAVLTLLDNLGQGGDNLKQGVVLWQSLLGL